MDFVQNILNIAKEHRYTNKQLCELLGKNSSYISDWKSGKSKPKADEIILLAKEFNVTTDYLLGRSEPEKTNADIKDIVDLSREEVMELLAPANQSTVVINIQNKGGENKAFEMDADDFSELMQLVELKKTMMRKNLDDK